MPTTPLPGLPGTGGSNTPWGLSPQVSDPTASANAAVTGDLANLPNLQNLAGQVNTFNTGQAIAPYIANLPGYSQMVGQSSQNIGNLLRGQVPQDVMGLLGQQAAERGASRGLTGSPNENAGYLRSLGLTSLGLQQQGEGELTSAIGRTPVPQLFNTAQFLTTPGDEQAAQQAANIYAAAPNPNMQAQALMDLFNRFSGRFSGSGGVTIDRGLGGYAGPQQPNTGGAGPTPGASGGAVLPVSGGPGSTLNTGAIFGQTGPGGFPANFQGPAINPNTGGASGGFGGPAINPWTGAANGGFQGPAIDPWSGESGGGFQGPSIDPWSGMASGGFQGPAADPWSGYFSGGFQGPAINPVSGGASGGFQGPAIDPWTGQYQDPYSSSQSYPDWAMLPYEEGP